MLSAASSLAWIAAVLGRESDIGGLIAGADAFARSKGAVASAPIFLPYLSGERTPHNDAEATGMFAGLRAGHGADALVFAVMEGVAFSFADGVDVLDAAGARPVRPLACRRGRAVGILGSDDRRRHRARRSISLPARKQARRSARQGSACLPQAREASRLCARARRLSASSSPIPNAPPPMPAALGATARSTRAKSRRGSNSLFRALLREKPASTFSRAAL